MCKAHHTINLYAKRMLLFLVFILSTIQLSAQTFGTLTTEDGLMDNSVFAIYQDADGLMYFGTYRGLDRFDGSHVVNIPFAESSGKETDGITTIVARDREHLLAGNAEGLWQLDKRQLTLTRVFKDDIDCGVTALRLASKGKDGSRPVVIETQFGVYELLVDRLRKVSNRRGALTMGYRFPVGGWGRFPSACSIFRSSTGNRWAGYNFFGVDYTNLNRGIFHVWAVPGVVDTGGLAVRNFLHDGDRLLLGTRAGLFVYDAAIRSYHAVCPELLGRSIIIQVFRQGDLYLVATVGQGIVVLDHRTLSPRGSFLRGANVYQICRDGHGALWVCTSKGLGRYDTLKGQLTFFTTRNSQLPSDEVYCIGFDSDGTGWLSTSGGLCQYRRDLQAIVATDLPNRVRHIGLLRSVESLGRDRLLLIPQHGRPCVYNIAADRLHTLPLQLTAGDDGVLFLHIANDSTFVFVTSNGIYAQKGAQLRRFGYIDGLPNLQFQSHAVTIDKQGRLWAATNSGLVYARLDDMLQHHFRHQPIILGQIQTDHWFSPQEATAVLLDHRLRLSRYRSEFTVAFSPVIYGLTGDLRYRYRLVGSDDEAWHEAPHDRILSFRHLAAGHYQLVIEAIGMPEVCTTVAIDVPLTYAAIFGIVLLLLALAFAAYVAYCKYRKIPYFWKLWERKPEHYQYSKLSPSLARQLQKRLLEVMENDKPYLTPTLQMSDLSKIVGCTSHELSQVFSQYMQRNYYDFIAEYRIKEFRRLAALPQYSKYTITALSELCGFRSRTPFLTAFKKFTGMTPKEYMKGRGQG